MSYWEGLPDSGSLPRERPASDPAFIPAVSCTKEGSAMHKLAKAFREYAELYGGGTRREFLRTTEGIRLKLAAYPDWDPASVDD